MTFSETRLKDAERLIRLAMIVTLCTAGVSKFFSHGSFVTYYSELFRAPTLRIHLPMILVEYFLSLTQYIEVGLGLALLYTPLKRPFVSAWCLYFITLEFGHYILEQWSSVNEMIPLILMGTICLVLPEHETWLSLKVSDSIQKESA